MNFRDCKKAVILTMFAERTPLVVGRAGIGKTSMAREIANEYNMHFINIDSNLLKEGEIGGLPMPKEKVDKEGRHYTVTDYALHNKIKEIQEVHEANPEQDILLFIDEFNRCAREVMQELMNLVLNREINGYELPKNVYIVAAMNPSQTNEKFKGDNTYQVNDMDGAQKDRYVWLYLDTDIKDFLDFASSEYTDGSDCDESELLAVQTVDYTSGQRIDNDIIEFLSSNPDCLALYSENQDINPSPRSWEALSNILKLWKANTKVFDQSILNNCIKGCIGDAIAIKFNTFIKNNKNPLIKPEDIFKGKTMDEKIKEDFKMDTLPRQMIVCKNSIRFLAEKKTKTKADYERLIQLLGLCPKDLLIVMMRFIKNSYNKTLNEKLMDNDDYLDLFTDTQRMLRG